MKLKTDIDQEESRAPESEKAREVKKPESIEAIGAEVKVNIDGMDVKVHYGSTILEAAKQVGINISTLCYHEDLKIAGVCRICVVEVEGDRTLQAACAYPITRPINVKTYSPKVRRARRHILDLLLSTHYGQCYTCKRNGNCELQKLAEEYGVDLFRFGQVKEPKYDIDDSSYSLVRDMNKCILCRRCIRTCVNLQEVGVLNVYGRGKDTRLCTFMDRPIADVICINCGQCLNRCPTAAITAQDPTDEVWADIDNPEKHVVIQTAPAPRACMGECFDIGPGQAVTFEMNTALRRVGFDKVFDTNFAADLTIIEEGTELLLRLKKALVDKDMSIALPQFTSCSPGWIKFIEHFYPEYIPNVSTAKSPQQMFGALIKTFYAKLHNIDPSKIVSIALMPCSAKKFECNRPEMRSSGFKDVDYGLTTRELSKMIKESGVDLPKLPKSDFDDPFGTATGSGVIFGVTGGVMEAAIRTVLELVTGKKVESIYEHGEIVPVRGFEGVRYAELKISEIGDVPEIVKHLFKDWKWLKGAILKVGICHGTANARRVMENIKAGGQFSQCHFIEFMACPGGCLGGGGQPIPTSPSIRAARAKAIYSEDRAYSIRKSHENPAVNRIYKEFLTDGPGGEISHQLLHTHYTKRGKYIT